MKCPTCGAENEAGNRFCEQCGSRIDADAGGAPAAPSAAAQPSAASATCPSCGATVLPGEAFCDECGASLSAVAPTAAPASISDVPTVQAPLAPGSAATDGQNVTCPACGHQNLPGDQFCDNCGAALNQPAASASPAPSSPPPAPAEPAAPAAPPDVAAPPDAAAPAAAASSPPAAQADAPTAEHPIIAGGDGSADAQAAYEAEQQRLNDEIGRQQKIIEQFEQMQTMFGAATPPAVTQGLADARDARARAEADLAALQPPAPPAPAADPAELARLNDEIGRQQKIIEQFEQMQTMFGAATPPAVIQGLADARDARARAEADLAALTGGAPAPAPAQPAAPAAAPAPAQPAEAAPPVPVQPATVEVSAENIPPPPPAAPAAPAAAPAAPVIGAPAGPRLVFDDGKELSLPTDKRDLIVGREDPISGIFPEIDLTPFGGETGGVSRQHARLTHADGQWSVTDLHSTNYTRVDGARIEPDVPVAVKAGARLQFGRVTMTFQA